MVSKSPSSRCARIPLMTIRGDVSRAKVRDRGFDGYQGALMARMAAVVDAQRAVAAREVGARPALRGALVNLAAISELLAEDLSSRSR
jgi:hypothetical protein